MVTADYYNPDWECLVDFFLQSGVEKLLAWVAAGIERITLDLSSQSGAYDLSATASPQNVKMICVYVEINLLIHSFLLYKTDNSNTPSIK